MDRKPINERRYINPLLSYLQSHDRHDRETRMNLVNKHYKPRQIKLAKRMLLLKVKTDIVPSNDDLKDIIDVILHAEPNTLPKFVKRHGPPSTVPMLSIFENKAVETAEHVLAIQKYQQTLVSSYESIMKKYAVYEMHKLFKTLRKKPERRHSI